MPVVLVHSIAAKIVQLTYTMKHYTHYSLWLQIVWINIRPDEAWSIFGANIHTSMWCNRKRTLIGTGRRFVVSVHQLALI